MAGVAIIVVLVLGLAVAATAVRYGPLVGDVRDFQDAAQRFASDVKAIEPTQLDRAALEGLQAQLVDLDTSLRPIYSVLHGDLLVGLLGAIPGIGPQVQGATALVEAADSLIQAGDIGLGLTGEIIALREADEADPSFALMPALLLLMTASSDQVDRIDELISAATASIDEVPAEAIGQIQEARDLVAEPLRQYGPVLEQYRSVDTVLPELLGWGEQKRYLVLAQNPAELRPQGGYSGTVGVIGFRDGQITEQAFTDVHKLDGKAGLPFIEAPPELVDHLLGGDQSWRLADAAWSADYPTAAAKALEFYQIETGDQDIDGVIAVTTYALDRLLDVLGPVTLEEYETTVKPGESTFVLLGETRGPGDGRTNENRKEILDALAREITQRLLSLPPDRIFGMVDAAGDIAEQRLAMAWFADPATQALLEDSGWAGSVRQDPGDYLYVVEANMAPTSKYNLVVDRSDSLVVKLSEGGDALDSLRLDWRNDAGKKGEPYQSLREFSNNQDGAYGAYVKVMVPNGSELLTVSGHAADDVRGAENVSQEADRATFANYLFMPPGDSTLTYLWTTPGAATQVDDAWEYQLVVQKQPGARPHPVSIRIDLPKGAVVLEAPEDAIIDGEQVRVQADLARDLELLVRYSLGDPPA